MPAPEIRQPGSLTPDEIQQYIAGQAATIAQLQMLLQSASLRQAELEQALSEKRAAEADGEG